MRLLIPATVIGLAVALAAGSVVAQQPGALQYPDGFYLAQDETRNDSPSDLVPVPPETDAELADVELADCDAPCGLAGCEPSCSSVGCGVGCGCNSCCSPFGGSKPWTIPQPCVFQKLGIRVGGWLEQGITFNGYGNGDGFNGTVGTNDLDGEYQMNQLWLYITKPINTQKRGWDIGGHIDLIYGSDWRFGINNGLENRINGFDRQTYGLVIPQMYAEVGVDKLSVKLGHMAGILDYEAVPAIMNPFYSHSLCYAFTVPQLVTGVLSEYKFSEQFSVQSGFHRGWMQFEDNNDRLDTMAGFKWKSTDGRTSLAWAFSTGPQDAAGNQDRFVYSLVGKRQVTERLEYIAVQNFGWENDGDFRSNQDAEWYGLNQYFLLKLCPKWQIGARVEWLRDDDGARVFGPPPVAGIRAWPRAPGFAGDFYEVTLGLNYRPHPNILIRPEVRWDWYDGIRNLDGELPYKDGNRASQFTIGGDAIVTF